ncbi:glycosyltransferase, partial [bacterium]|nr:glycosyltransferase [bacterium]
MRICFIADANSIHAQRWIEYFCKPENEVFILSTTRNPKPMKGAVVYDLFTGKSVVPSAEYNVAKSKWSLRSLLTRVHKNNKVGNFIIRLWAKVNEIMSVYRIRLLFRTFRLARKARAIVENLQPDIIHCHRLPIEGYIGGLVGHRPLVISTWGNDMVYWARRYYIFRWLTRKALSKTDLFFPDNTRDKYIAEVYGFSPSNPSHVIHVTGGLKLEDFPLYLKEIGVREKLGFDSSTNIIVSTRGLKNFYINTDNLIRAIPHVVEIHPNSLFVLFGGTQSNTYLQLKKLAEQLKVEQYIRFMSPLSYNDYLDYLAASDILVQIIIYEGWPISLLEAMAHGVIPIMSNHSPMHEWIVEGWNGYLVDPTNPAHIAQTIIKALENKDNFEIMRQRNWDILRERGDYHRNIKVAEERYYKLIERG